MAGKRRRKKKHNIRNFIIVLVIIASGGIGLYAHFGGDEARAHLYEAKSHAQRVFYETGEKLGLAEPVSRLIQQAQELWDKVVPGSEPKIEIADIPEYAGSPFVEINGNIPQFDEADLTRDAFEEYSPLDILKCRRNASF